MDKRVPAGPASIGIVIDNSRFIADAAPASSVEEARAFIAAVKKAFPDASHHVPAFIIGHGNSTTTHCNDDGEPAGTAGRPALAVLSGSGLGNIAVVITRYFGGIKLGTGGLVRAYTSAVQEVLKVLPIGRLISTTTVMLTVDYALFARTRDLIQTCGGKLINQDFGVDVTLSVKFESQQADDFRARLIDLSHGRATLEVIETDPNAIMPE